MRSTRGIKLRPVMGSDLQMLQLLLCDPERFHLWGHRRVCDEAQFIESWRYWSAERMASKFTVLKHDVPIGLVFDYDRVVDDGHSKIATVLLNNAAGTGNGLFATALFAEWIFRTVPLRKVYLDVFGFNGGVIRMLDKLAIPREMCLREHRYWNGQFWDQIGFALTRDSAIRLHRRFLNRPLRRPFTWADTAHSVSDEDCKSMRHRQLRNHESTEVAVSTDSVFAGL